MDPALAYGIGYGVGTLLAAILSWQSTAPPPPPRAYPFYRELVQADSAERQAALLGAVVGCTETTAPFYQGRLADIMIFSITCPDKGAHQVWVAPDNRAAAMPCAPLPAERACYVALGQGAR
jgi:hypothetical protein